MASKQYKPTTPGRRKMGRHDFARLTKKKPEKSLVRGKSSKGGRGNSGRITVRFKGGGHKRKLRDVDFKRDKRDISAKVIAVEYDPLRDENQHYAQLLQSAGVATHYHCYPGLIHGFFDLYAISEQANRACQEIIAEAKKLIAD